MGEDENMCLRHIVLCFASMLSFMYLLGLCQLTGLLNMYTILSGLEKHAACTRIK